jgi:hypothetical protein
MTRSRLAAVAALSIVVLPVAALGGEAPADDYRSKTTCKTRHTMTRDFAKLRTKLLEREAPGDSRRAGAAAFVPVEGAKVITRLIDLTMSNGESVVDRKKNETTIAHSDRAMKLTNARGVAKTKHEFTKGGFKYFGDFRARVKVKVDGDVVARDAIDFGVPDRVDGRCDPPTSPSAG